VSFDTRLWNRFEMYDALGDPLTSGGLQLHEQPVRHALANNEKHDQTHSVATTAIIKLFDVADDLASFEWLFVISDKAGSIQLVNNTAARWFTMGMVANIPFTLASDAGEQGDGSVGAFDDTSDDIEAVYFKNTSADTATVRIVAGR